MKKILMLIPFWFSVYGCMTAIGIVYDLPDENLCSLSFDETTRRPEYQFIFSDISHDRYLRQLRETYRLDSLTANSKNSLDKSIRILHWAHTRFSHSGSQQPKQNDALSILKEAEGGKSFRCVEYGIVCAAALNSIGLPARRLGLQTRDVETVEIGAGHVATEVYLPELKKWAFLDPQFNVFPMLDESPLNAVEFQRAIIGNKALKLMNAKGEVFQTVVKEYLQFIAKYLYYFDAPFDHRNIPDEDKYSPGSLTILQLGPLTALQPKLFQRRTIRAKAYTHSMADFYSEPVVQ